MAKKRKKSVQQRATIKAYAMQYGYMLLFLPALIATIAFGIYYYLTIYTTIVSPSTADVDTSSVQIQTLTESVESSFLQKKASAEQYAENAVESPFAE